jgi:lysozyme
MATKAVLEQAWKSPNARAFLDMISAAEGTTKYGYFTLVGDTKLSSLSAHPNTVVRLKTKHGTIPSTAAGRYQFLFRTWKDVATKLQLPDFGPHSQDLAALELVARRGGLTKVLNGDLNGAISACRKEWASFPGAGYGQGERSLAFMQSKFNQALAQYGSTSPVTPTTAASKPPTTGGAGGTVLGMAVLPPAMALQNPGAMFGGLGTIMLVGGAALAAYFLFFRE